MRRLIFLSLFLLSCSAENEERSLLNSDVLSENIATAEAKFSQRDQNLSQLLESRYFTRSVLESMPENSRKSWQGIKLTEVYFRTYYYHAVAYLKEDNQKEARRALYTEAIAELEKYLNPDVLGFDSAQYYYFKALFYTKLSDDSTFLEQLQHLSKLSEIFNKTILPGGSLYGIERYEGGGLYRLKAIMKYRESYRGVPGGTWNPDEALKLINVAIKSDAYPENIDGQLLCENLKVKADIEYSLHRDPKRAALFNAQTAYIFSEFRSDDIIPEYIRAETDDCIAESRNLIIKNGYDIRSAFDGDDDHDFTYTGTATFVSPDKKDATILLEAYCSATDYLFAGPSDLAKSKEFLYRGNTHAGRVNAITLEVNGNEVQCAKMFFVFDPARLNLKYVNLDLDLDKNLTNEKYVEVTEAALSKKAIELLSFSTSMAGQMLAKPNMFCMIKNAELKGIDAGVLENMKNNYFDLFGTRYAKDSFKCPPDETLETEIRACKADSALSTPFCNSYRQYIIPLKWVMDNLVETKARLAALGDSESKIKDELTALRDQLQVEADQSKDVLGENDD